jgi:hypothetical protein
MEHRVPYYKRDKAEGWRLNLTIRMVCTEIRNPTNISADEKVDLGDGCSVLLWKQLFNENELEQLTNELLCVIHKNGVPDITKMYGKTFTNKGRTVLEMANENGFKYQYAGKTVTGIAFTECVRKIVIPKMAILFGVQPKDLWCHLVYYPTPDCKLDWHDDGEDGINPNLIISLTLLENLEKGARTFQVRRKPENVSKRPRKSIALGTKQSNSDKLK